MTPSFEEQVIIAVEELIDEVIIFRAAEMVFSANSHVPYFGKFAQLSLVQIAVEKVVCSQ